LLRESEEEIGTRNLKGLVTGLLMVVPTYSTKCHIRHRIETVSS
jgi:hypothetical protein